jgi:hypothetical protein
MAMCGNCEKWKEDVLAVTGRAERAEAELAAERAYRAELESALGPQFLAYLKEGMVVAHLSHEHSTGEPK